MSREALLSALGQGGDKDPYAAPTMERFTPTPLPQAGAMDKILGIAGLGGQAIDMAGGLDTLAGRFARRGNTGAGQENPEDDLVY